MATDINMQNMEQQVESDSQNFTIGHVEELLLLTSQEEFQRREPSKSNMASNSR